MTGKSEPGLPPTIIKSGDMLKNPAPHGKAEDPLPDRRLSIRQKLLTIVLAGTGAWLVFYALFILSDQLPAFLF